MVEAARFDYAVQAAAVTSAGATAALERRLRRVPDMRVLPFALAAALAALAAVAGCTVRQPEPQWRAERPLARNAVEVYVPSGLALVGEKVNVYRVDCRPLASGSPNFGACRRDYFGRGEVTGEVTNHRVVVLLPPDLRVEPGVRYEVGPESP